MFALPRMLGLLLLTLICVTVLSSIAGDIQAEETGLVDSRGTLEGKFYTFNGTPAFRIQVPRGCTLGERSDPKVQMVSLRTPEGITVEASVVAVDETFAPVMEV